MVKTEDEELIDSILNRIAQLKPGQLIGVYDMLVTRNNFQNGNVAVSTGPRNAEQLLVFLNLWQKSGIEDYHKYQVEILARMRYKRGRWYLTISEKLHIEESEKIKMFLTDLKSDLELYIIHCLPYNISTLKNKYLA